MSYVQIFVMVFPVRAVPTALTGVVPLRVVVFPLRVVVSPYG